MLRNKRSRECIDTVVHAEISARQFVFDLLAHGITMHRETHAIEQEFFGGADNMTEYPEPRTHERILRYWIHYDLLPSPTDTLVFSNKYEIGVLQSKPIRCPPALPTDGTVFLKKGKF